MKRKTKVVQISGFRGLVMAIFVVTCLAAGFIAFPSIVAMNIWNFAAEHLSLPLINVWQGVMLWAIVAISGFIINDRKKYLMAFSTKNQLTEAELNNILRRAKFHAQARALDSMYLKSEDLKNVEKDEMSEKKEKENV